MASIAGKTKILTCTKCGQTFTGSLYASAKTAMCDQCKTVNAKVGMDTPKPVINQVLPQIPEITSITIHQTEVSEQDVVVMESKPVKVLLIRNRSLIDTEIVMDTGEIIPVENHWKQVDNEFNIDYLSFSRLDTYARCPALFYHQVVNNQNPDEDGGNIFTWFGTILHNVMEESTKMWYDNGIKANILSLYDSQFKQSPLHDLSMYNEGRILILDYFKRHPIGSEPYIPFNVNGAHTAEYEWRGQLGDVPIFSCKFDFIGKIDEETGIIKDYKSNRHPYTRYELEDSLQLGIYELIARICFPNIKNWITGYEMFRFDWQQCPERSDGDLDSMLSYINNMWYKITHDTVWEERLNGLCGYCDRRHVCKNYCGFINDPKRLIDIIKTDTLDITEAYNSYNSFNDILRIAEKRKNELGDIIKKEIEAKAKSGSKLLIADGKEELYLQSQSRPFYDYNASKQILAMSGKMDLLDGCASVNKTKMDSKLKSDPQLMMEMQRCLIPSYTAPYLMKRKGK